MSKRAAFASRVGVSASKSNETRTSEIAKSVVRRNATGSVRLQLGDFVDKSDLDRQFERIKHYRFVSG